MKVKYYIILPCIQACLIIAAVITDLSKYNGYGEGDNQVIANMLTNVEFYIKNGLGYDDIEIFNFRIFTSILSILIWFLVGLIINKIINWIKSIKEHQP
jgi:hypothetical protein